MKRLRVLLVSILALTTALVTFFAVGCFGNTNPPKKYTVTYSTESSVMGTVQGSTDSGSFQSGASFNKNTSITLTATENNGYEFDGWYDGATPVSNLSVYEFSLTANVNLVAKFNAKKYELTVSSENENMGSVSIGATVSPVAYGESVTVTATALEGYEFIGWFDGNTQKSTDAVYPFDMPSEALALTAKFQPLKYALNISSDNSGMGSVSMGATVSPVAYGEGVTITATPLNGYDFIGWYDGEDTLVDNAPATYTFTMPNNALTFVAKFQAIKYPLSVTSENENMGTVSIGSTVSPVAFGSSVTAVATPLNGYEFIGWYDGEDNLVENAPATYPFPMPANSVTLVAKFQAIKYELTVACDSDSIGMGNVSMGATVSPVAYGASVTVTATAYEGYEFIGWYDGNTQKSTDTDYTFYMQIGALNLTARFQAIKYALTIASENEDMGSVSMGATVSPVAYGESVTVTATAYEGYVFVGWYDGVSEESLLSEYTFDMPNNALNLTAKFVAKEYELTVSSENEDMGNVSMGATYSPVAYGESVTVSAIAYEGYKFVAWYEGTNFKSADVNYTFNMPYNALNLIAKFEREKYTLTYNVNVVDAGTITPSGTITNGSKVTYGESVTLTAAEETGYDFIGWYCGGELESEDLAYTFNMPYNAYDLVATFKAESRTITYWSDNTIVHTDDTLFYGDTATEYEPTKNGYVFGGWFIIDGETSTLFEYDTVITENLNLYAKWQEDKKKFDVNFVCDGIIIYTKTYTEGVNVIQAPGATVKTEYDFVRWEYYDKTLDKNVELGSELNVTENITVTAVYAIKQFTVTFYAYDKVVFGTDTVDYGSTASVASPVSEDYKEENYVFVQWLDDLGMPFNLATNTITESISLYAEWREKPAEAVEISFYGEDGTLKGTKTVAIGATISESEFPNAGEVKGKDFAYWYYGDNETKFTAQTEVTASMAGLKVYAKYTAKTFELTYVYKNTDGTEKEYSCTVDYGYVIPETTDSVENFTVPTGHTFDKWDMKGVSVENDMTITAIYKANSITVYFVDAEEEKTYHTATVAYGGCLSVPAQPTKDGYSFAGWFTYDGADYTVFDDFSTPITVTTDKHYLYARFTEIVLEKYTVKFTLADGTVVFEQSVEEGYNAIVPSAPAITGKNFENWLNAADNSVVTDFTNITSNLTLIAEYSNKEYTVSFYGFDGEFIKSEQVEYQLTAASVAPAMSDVGNMKFTGWDKSIDTLKIERNTDFYARYEMDTRTVNFYVYDLLGQPKLHATMQVGVGLTADIPSTPSMVGYEFSYWSLTSTAGNLEGEAPIFNFSTAITEDTDFYAKFTKTADVYIVTFVVNGRQHGEIQQLAVVNGVDIYVTEPQPYVDGDGNVYTDWKVHGTDELFDFNTSIQSDLTLYINTQN